MKLPQHFIDNISQILWENQHGTPFADAAADQQAAWRTYVRVALETFEERKGKVMRWDGEKFVEVA